MLIRPVEFRFIIRPFTGQNTAYTVFPSANKMPKNLVDIQLHNALPAKPKNSVKRKKIGR
jgi:hypothetical protein